MINPTKGRTRSLARNKRAVREEGGHRQNMGYKGGNGGNDERKSSSLGERGMKKSLLGGEKGCQNEPVRGGTEVVTARG